MLDAGLDLLTCISLSTDNEDIVGIRDVVRQELEDVLHIVGTSEVYLVQLPEIEIITCKVIQAETPFAAVV